MTNSKPNKEWPEASDKVIFRGVPSVYYPHFLSMQTFCKDNLIVGQEYILAKASVHSSWVSVELVGFEGTFLNWVFFKYADE